jgi:serine protease Do
MLLASLATAARAAAADAPFEKTTNDVNNKLVKLFGSGGFKGLTHYGTGIVVSPQGHILTVANQLLDTQDLRIHLADGRRFRAKVLYTEPELDAALLVIKQDEKDKVDLDLEYFDIPAAAKNLKAQPGDWVLAFSNCFEIATRDEPMSVQRGVISAYTKLVARRGIYEVPYHGEVFFFDQIFSNPGSAGGAVTTRKGELVGMLGKEYRNVTSDTWINYALPVNAAVEVKDGDKIRKITLEELVVDGIKGTYKPPVKRPSQNGPGAYHGIVFVPNVLQRTPPYIDRVAPNSPAQKAKLQADDLIVYVDGEPVYSIQTFKEIVSKLVPGSRIQLEVRRGDKLTAVELELAEFPK